MTTTPTPDPLAALAAELGRIGRRLDGMSRRPLWCRSRGVVSGTRPSVVAVGRGARRTRVGARLAVRGVGSQWTFARRRIAGRPGAAERIGGPAAGRPGAAGSVPGPSRRRWGRPPAR